MLKKLLKYDFKAVLKIWWIAAAAMLALSPIGGLCFQITFSDRRFAAVVNTIAAIGMALTYVAFAAFVLLSALLLAIRFYKNFFNNGKINLSGIHNIIDSFSDQNRKIQSQRHYDSGKGYRQHNQNPILFYISPYFK